MFRMREYYNPEKHSKYQSKVPLSTTISTILGGTIVSSTNHANFNSAICTRSCTF